MTLVVLAALMRVVGVVYTPWRHGARLRTADKRTSIAVAPPDDERETPARAELMAKSRGGPCVGRSAGAAIASAGRVVCVVGYIPAYLSARHWVFTACMTSSAALVSLFRGLFLYHS